MRFRGILLALSIFFLASASSLAVDTVWNFDGSLSAASGTATMQYRGSTASMSSFGTTASYGLPPIYGGDGTTNVMKFPTFPEGDTTALGYSVMHGVGELVPEYTMIWDVLYPDSSDIAWRNLYQTNTTNTNDGDLYVANNPWGGIGISSQYHGVIKPGEWNRIAITRNADGTMAKYINGGYVGQQNVVDTRWRLDANQYLILTDDNGHTAGGYIASHRFVDHAMTQQEILQLGGVHADGSNASGEVFDDPSTFEPGSFTIAVLGDTQCYSNSATYSQTFNQMTQWLVDNKESRNIQFVAHVGDIVDSNTTEQWDRAANALHTLDGQIPYALVPGNHDYSASRTASQFDGSTRFGPGTAYASQSTLGGYFPFEPNSRMNTYHTFSVGDQDFLVLALEFGPRDAVVEWAKSVVNSHPDHRAILLTHAYMYGGGDWFDHSVDPDDPQGRTYDQILDAEYGRSRSAGNPHSYSWVSSDCNDGRELWDKLVKDREDFSLVLTGHQFDEYDGFPYQLNQGTNGNSVYQMLFDTQARVDGGEGWIRLLEFSADGKTVKVKTYSPQFDQWSYASDEYYTIELAASKVAGDANGDGKVDGSDVTIVAGNWQHGVTGTADATWAMGDFNGDGKVDGSDVTILAGNWQYGVTSETNSVPEPGTLALIMTLASGLLIFERRFS